MKKKLMLFLILVVLNFCCSSCSTFEITHQAYELYKTGDTEPFETKSNFEEDFVNYVEQQFKEKYGKEFKLLGFHSPFMSISRDCDMKCIDDGIEFQATVHSKDYYEVEKENYLLYKYFSNIQDEIVGYVGQYFSNYKIVADDISEKLPFEVSADVSYDELKNIMYNNNCSVSFRILIPEDTVFSETEWNTLVEKIASSNEYTNDDINRGAYKRDINLEVYLTVFRLPNEVYNNLESIITEEEYFRNEIYDAKSRIL